MRKMILASAIGAMSLVCGPQTSLAQTAATQPAVVNQCAEVAAEEVRQDGDAGALRGLCIGATQFYLAALRANGASGAGFDIAITDLVIGLAGILDTPFCVEQSEVVRAIQIAGSEANDIEQATQINLIADTVSRCNNVITASIVRINDLVPESLSSRNTGGSQVSPN